MNRRMLTLAAGLALIATAGTLPAQETNPRPPRPADDPGCITWGYSTPLSCNFAVPATVSVPYFLELYVSVPSSNFGPFINAYWTDYISGPETFVMANTDWAFQLNAEDPFFMSGGAMSGKRTSDIHVWSPGNFFMSTTPQTVAIGGAQYYTQVPWMWHVHNDYVSPPGTYTADVVYTIASR